MISNYFKIAWRNLMKNKVFSFINIFGLSIGLTCCMLISLHIYNEMSYDTYHKNGDRIYLLGTDFMMEGKSEPAANSSAPLGKTMKAEFPEIEDQARIMQLFSDDKTLIQHTDASGNTKNFYETKGFVADSNFFKILTYYFKEGNAATALMEPNTVVLNDDIAGKLFGKESALNKVVHISSSTNGDHDFKVTGVYKAPPTPSHIDAHFIMSMRGGRLDRMANDNPSMLNNNMFYTYLLLKNGADAGKLRAKFPGFIQRHLAEELKAAGRQRQYVLAPLKDIYMRAGLKKPITEAGSLTSLYILGSIAILTLLIACINFMNLSTSSSSKRASEVGVRKVLGAEKRSLLWQFLGESLLMAGIALLFAALFTQLLLPLFEKASGKTIAISFQQHTLLYAGFVVLAIITGLLAGSYPAFYLSSFKPIQVLKGKFKNSLAAVSLRKGMVVFQFVISIALIVASVIIADQMKFMRSKDLGFVKDQQVILPLRTATAKAMYTTLKNEVANNPNIKSVGASMYYPGIFNPTDWMVYKEGQTKDMAKRIYINFVDYGFLKTIGIQPKEGRLFSEQFPSDTLDRFVINEQATKEFGYKSPKDAVGSWIGFEPADSQYRLTIIGVVKDFHFKDFHVPIEPYGFLLNTSNRFNYLMVTAKGNDISGTIKSLEATWHKLNPNEPFEYSFLDADFQKNFDAENRQATLINYFTIIAIIISCLGLFGLATFSAEQRIKEIGVRKVLGASVGSIVALLSKDFLKLVGIAIIVACPVAWWAMDKWLQNFAYRTSVSWQVFALTTLLAITVAVLTISFQAIKAAISNPVKSLRTE
jgi:putative ABC transport system permease protein